MIQPAHDNLLIRIKKPIQGEQKTESGIIVATSKSRPVDKESTGYVVAVGTGRYLSNGTIIPSCAKIGDKVIFNKFSGTEIEDEDGDDLFLLIKENDILAIIK